MKHMFRIAVAATLLCACVPGADGQTPPAGASGAAAAAADSASAAARALRRSWVSDRRHYEAGDVITVLVDEYTLASANKATLAVQDRSRRATLVAGEGVGGFARGDLVDVGVRTGTTGQSRERGQATRQDRFTAEVSVRVVGVEPGGLLRVEGTKRILVDEQEQEITLRGLVRPQDISAENVIESWRVADAEIAYRPDGDLGKPKQGILSRILGLLWP